MKKGNVKMLIRNLREMEENKQCTIHNVVDSALWKDEKHSHFWVEDGELYESYNTIRGLRYRHRLSVNGVADCDNCPLDMLLYIVKEYIED
jgi:hypothetical protein